MLIPLWSLQTGYIIKEMTPSYEIEFNEIETGDWKFFFMRSKDLILWSDDQKSVIQFWSPDQLAIWHEGHMIETF
jgi:hypothetical protein